MKIIVLCYVILKMFQENKGKEILIEFYIPVLVAFIRMIEDGRDVPCTFLDTTKILYRELGSRPVMVSVVDVAFFC